MKLTGSLIIVACAALLYGCASTVPRELVDARLAYRHASEGPAAQLAPADLHKAQQALAEAEKSFSKDADSYETRDLAYVAHRKAQAADAQASIVTEQESAARSATSYQTTQGSLLQERTEDLNQARTALAVSEREGQAMSSQLSTEQQARREAERQTAEQRLLRQEKSQDLNQARTALAVSERSGQATSNQLSAEQQARLEAEKKAAEQRMLTQEASQDLSQARTALAVSERAGETMADQLTAEQQARLEAEKKAAVAQTALAQIAALKETARGMVITLSGSVIFRSGESALLPGAASRLDQVVDALSATNDRNVLVEGYTDSQGSDEYNRDLSQRRADAVRDCLVRRGYDASRIRARGIGEGSPIADNTTAEGRANNRRVEILLERADKQ